MKILHISDSHCYHHMYELEEADVLCYTGDETNSRNKFQNHREFLSFYRWLKSQRDKFKKVMFTPGNHSVHIYNNESSVREKMSEIDVDFLNGDSVVFEDVVFYGDPISPSFGDWVYTKNRDKTVRNWDKINIETNVLLTHTPPKGILDLHENKQRVLELCGDGALGKMVFKLPELKAHLFGHIHDNSDIKNNGILVREDIIFSNATAIKDGEMEYGLKHNKGNKIII